MFWAALANPDLRPRTLALALTRTLALATQGQAGDGSAEDSGGSTGAVMGSTKDKTAEADPNWCTLTSSSPGCTMPELDECGTAGRLQFSLAYYDCESFGDGFEVTVGEENCTFGMCGILFKGTVLVQ